MEPPTPAANSGAANPAPNAHLAADPALVTADSVDTAAATAADAQPLSLLDNVLDYAPAAFVALFALLFAVTWVMWLLGAGRFKQTTDKHADKRGPPLSYLLSDFITKLISDFQHFFALVIVGVFCWMVYRMTALGIATKDFPLVEKGLAMVLNTPFGGVVISMIAYYFGEQAGRKRNAATSEGVTKDPVGLPIPTIPPPPGAGGDARMGAAEVTPTPNPPDGDVDKDVVEATPAPSSQVPTSSDVNKEGP